jgi:hypothetical protein
MERPWGVKVGELCWRHESLSGVKKGEMKVERWREHAAQGYNCRKQ